MHCDGISGWGRFGTTDQCTQGQGTLEGKLDPGHLRADLPGREAHPRPQSVAPRPQVAECVPDQVEHRQTRGLRHRQNAHLHQPDGQNHGRHPLLPLPRNRRRQALQLQK